MAADSARWLLAVVVLIIGLGLLAVLVLAGTLPGMPFVQPETSIVAVPTLPRLVIGTAVTALPARAPTAGAVAPPPTAPVASITPLAPAATLAPTASPPPSPTATPSPPPTDDRLISAVPATGVPPAPTVAPATPAATPTPSRTPVAAAVANAYISGSALLSPGRPAAGVLLRLANARYESIAEAVTSGSGYYVFGPLLPSEQGYNVIFSQNWNHSHPLSEVAAWGWIGPAPLAGGQRLALPDFVVGLGSLRPVEPAVDARIALAQARDRGIRFAWQPFSETASYWIDVSRKSPSRPGELESLWQSELVRDSHVLWDGSTRSGLVLRPGEYWWEVGAQRQLTPYFQVHYTYQSRFTIDP